MTEIGGQTSDASKRISLRSLLLAPNCLYRVPLKSICDLRLLISGSVLAVCAFLFVVCYPIEAQQLDKVGRIGFLGFNNPVASQEFIQAFRQGLRDCGYTEGKNIIVEYRWADGNPARLPKLAAELVGLKVDVIFAAAASAIRAAKGATTSTPIVFEMLADPVRAGFVKSLANPGGNLTGIAGLGPELSGKRLELLKEIIPKLIVVAVLANPGNPNFQSVLAESEKTASALKLRLQVYEVREAARLAEGFATMAKERVEALTVMPDSMLLGNRKTILNLAVKNRLAAVYGTSVVVGEGGLMAYAPSQTDMWRRAATYVDRILKGAKPADLPVEQPLKFELAINLKTAKQIGLTIPPNVLARAEKVIR
jgi:putative ABC transport system substrate-binding protein